MARGEAEVGRRRGAIGFEAAAQAGCDQMRPANIASTGVWKR